jgi:hypothetical protein
VTVHWTTVPDTTSDRLDNFNAPLEFYTDRDVSYISIQYRDKDGVKIGKEEVVYRDNDFREDYAGVSTRVGNVFTVRRSDYGGIWPGNPHPYVQEVPIPPAAPSGGQSWGLLYEVDLTAQPNQAMTGSQSYVIDGKTWWVKGALAASQTVGLGTVVTTAGLPRTGLGTRNGASSGQSFVGAATLGFSVFYLPFAQLTGFNPEAPIFVETLSEGWLIGSNGVKVVCGIVEAEATTAAWASASRGSEILTYFQGAYAGGFSGHFSSAWQSALSQYHTDLVVYEMAALRATSRSGAALWNAAGGLVGPDGAGVGSGGEGVKGTRIGPVVSGSKLGFMFGEENGVSQTGAAWLKALRVYQPKVAA